LVYNIADGTQVLSLIAHPSWVTTLAYTSDGNKIISGGSDNRVKIWTNTGSLLYTCIGHTDDISSVKVTPDNKFIVSASKDKQIKVWDISNGELVKTFVGHDNSVNGIDLSPDGSKIVSGSSDGTIKIWNLNTGKMLNTFGKPDSGAVRAVAWSPKGDKIAAGNISSDLMVWSVPEVLGFPTYRMKNEFEFAIYPNPAKNKLTLDFSQDLKISSVEITDMLGRVVYISKGIDSDIQIDSLNTGLYSCKVTTDKGKTAVSTFVKNE
jgi:WD40 repeat protein